jgi:threonyl-tRNA synthetase
VTADKKADKMGTKIRHAQLQKLPYILVIGALEAASRQVAVREDAVDWMFL